MRETYTGPLWVPGHPVPKGSMKCVAKHAPGHRARLVPDKRTDPDNWNGRVPSTLNLRLPELVAAPLDGPLQLDVTFHLARAKSTKFKDAPIGQGTGDLDKLVRGVGDAIQNSDILVDDSRITRIVAEKIYAPDGVTEGAVIELSPDEPPVMMSGSMPVRVLAGRVNALVGYIGDAAELPALLRKVADQIEAGQ